jgi:hypothetical protein
MVATQAMPMITDAANETMVRRAMTVLLAGWMFRQPILDRGAKFAG